MPPLSVIFINERAVKGAIYYASELLSYRFYNVIRPTNDSLLHSLTHFFSFSSLRSLFFYRTTAHPLHQHTHTSVFLTALVFWGYTSVLHFPHPFPLLNSVIVWSEAVWRDRRESCHSPQTGDESLRGCCQDEKEKRGNSPMWSAESDWST